jgi:hypothetical protein
MAPSDAARQPGKSKKRARSTGEEEPQEEAAKKKKLGAFLPQKESGILN